MATKGYLVHRVPGRARLKFPAFRGNREFFANLNRQLEGRPGVLAITVNAATGSLLLEHDLSTPLEHILEPPVREGLFDYVEQEPPPPAPVPAPSLVAVAAKGVDLVNQGLAATSGGRVDLPSVYFLAHIGMGILEVTRGHVMPPAITLFWRALEGVRKR
ncbi:MAG: hypothetical protein FIA97_08175 [Methylococcaceae bacterium]|nr:hypothetical protein [Methylococcaceae bacterium]